MLTRNKIILISLFAVLLLYQAMGETLPPGKYDCSGRVVKRANR
jgi:hypothetical protein